MAQLIHGRIKELEGAEQKLLGSADNADASKQWKTATYSVPKTQKSKTGQTKKCIVK